MPKKNKKRFSRRTQRNNRTRRTIRGGWISPLRSRYTLWRETRAAATAARRTKPATLRSPLRMWRERNRNRVVPTGQSFPAEQAERAINKVYANSNARFEAAAHDLEKTTENQEVLAAGVMNALNRASILPSAAEVDAYIGNSRNGAAAVNQQRTSSVQNFDFPPAGKIPAVPTLPPAGQKMIIERTLLSQYQRDLLQGIVGSKTESDHIKFAARELLKEEVSALTIPIYNKLIECIFIGSRRDKNFAQRRQSTGEWGLNYDFTVKHMVDHMNPTTGASKFYATRVAELIEGVNSLVVESKVKSVNALFSIYMTLRRELACATTMNPPYIFNLNQQHAVHIAIPNLITMIENTVHPESLATAMYVATTENFDSVNRVNTISQSEQPIYNRFLQYAEYLNRIL